MGFRFRKSFKIAPGLKINLGGKSAGVSVGGKYGGISANSRTGTTGRASAYGTGLSYRKKLGGGRGKKFSLWNFFLSLCGVILLVVALGDLTGITAEQFGLGLAIFLMVAAGAVALWLLWKLIRFVRWLVSLVKKSNEPPEETVPEEAALQTQVRLELPEEEKPKNKLPWLNPKDFDEYANIELSRPETVFRRMPPLGSFVELKPEPEYPRDSKAIKATWVYEGEEKIAGYIKKSNADIRNIVREYWESGGQVIAQVRYNYDELGVFIGFNR